MNDWKPSSLHRNDTSSKTIGIVALGRFLDLMLVTNLLLFMLTS